MYGTPRRRRWFVLGLIAGMLLFPWAAGFPYEESGRRVGRRALKACAYLKERVPPLVKRGVSEVKEWWSGQEEAGERQAEILRSAAR